MHENNQKTRQETNSEIDKGLASILLAYDGSHAGRIALRCATPILRGQSSELHLLAVVPVTGALASADGFYSEAMYAAERDRVQAVLDEGVRLLHERGLHAQGYLRAGQPAYQISQLAKELQVDLVVVGHRKRGLART